MTNSFLKSKEISVSKLIVEVRVIPRLDFYDRVFKIAQSFTDSFEQWAISTSGVGQEVTLRNLQNRKSLTLRQFMYSLIFELPSAGCENEFERHLMEVLRVFENDKIVRFGLRAQTFRSLDLTFEESVKLFSVLNHPRELRALQFLQEQVTDDSLNLDAIKDGWNFHFESGVCRKDEIVTRSSYSFDASKENIKDAQSYFWVDVDTSTKDFESSKFSEVLKDAYRLSAERIDGLHEFFEVNK